MFEMINSIYPDQDATALKQAEGMANESSRRLDLLEKRDAIYRDLQEYMASDNPNPHALRVLENRLELLRKLSENTPFEI